MLLQNIDSLAQKQIFDFASTKFWQQPDFWIFIVLGLGGIYISLRGLWYSKDAFIEAGKAKDAATAAKDAANRAGKTVKNQSILLTISETTKVIGHITKDTNYENTYNRLMDVNAKIRNIIGFYGDKEGLNQNHQDLLGQIGVGASDVMIEFNLLDPEAETKIIYNKIRPIITILSGHLSELQGVLENELISNNN
jgi:hypothetical protein